MNKVVVIGIDSMDYELLCEYCGEMPTLGGLLANNLCYNVGSTFPPDSDTAWASIYTGRNPAEHGVINFVDPLEKSIEIQTKESESVYLKGKTFWDYAGSANKEVCILFPHVGFPPWDVNGIMVSRSRIRDLIISKPEAINKIDQDKVLNTPKGVPRKDPASLRKLIDRYKQLVEHETNYFISKYISRSWDIFFCYSSALDAIQHYFWNCDDSQFSNTIKDFYVIYDNMVNRIIRQLRSGTTVIILSDHGHGGRPRSTININEILRRNGFLKDNEKPVIDSAFDSLKSRSVKIVSQYDLGWLASKIFKLAPALKNVYAKSYNFDPKLSVAYVTDLSGIKSYTYGGIIINRDIARNYDETRNAIVCLIQDQLKEKLKWIKPREEVYRGEYLDKYPDILLQLKEGYGLGNKIHRPILDAAYSSNIVPGSHRGETAVLFVYNSERIITKPNIQLTDIAPTILDCLGVKCEEGSFDGTSIFG